MFIQNRLIDGLQECTRQHRCSSSNKTKTFKRIPRSERVPGARSPNADQLFGSVILYVKKNPLKIATAIYTLYFTNRK